MFEGLADRLGGIFDRLRKHGALSEGDVTAALREVRIALLEADVALPVVKTFIEKVRERAVGQEVLRSITPAQQVVKIVHDNLVEMLGTESEQINLNAAAPIPVMLIGLQGSGKTTTSAKIAKRLSERERKKVLMASLDTRRPAAQEQLRILGEQVKVATLPIVPGEDPVTIARRAMSVGRLEGYDVVLLDTAGRLAIDAELMAEVAAVRDAVQPVESLLVVDAMTGQDAVTVATNFDRDVGVTGLVLTRIDGDARGGAALSLRGVTGKPIKLIGTGEKLDALDAFHPERIASRILGMGDIVSLVERAAETIDKEEAEKLAKKVMGAGEFDLDDMLGQLRQIKKMGGMSGMMGLLPGVAKIKEKLAEANVDQSILKKQEAILLSMTKAERRNPKLLNASRRRRIAAGSGCDVSDINRLLKQYEQMRGMMKQVKKLGKKGIMRQGLSGLLGGLGGKRPF